MDRPELVTRSQSQTNPEVKLGLGILKPEHKALAAGHQWKGFAVSPCLKIKPTHFGNTYFKRTLVTEAQNRIDGLKCRLENAGGRGLLPA